MCKPNAKKLCGSNDCDICYNRSFATHVKSKFWSKLNDLSPMNFHLKSSKKVWFTCENCLHDFLIILSNIVANDSWCPYCCKPPQKLCENNDCKECFSKSFASHEKSKLWSQQNIKQPRQVFLNSNSEYLFDCKICKHTFPRKLYEAIKGIWCPYCNGHKICDANDCSFCYEKSFASHKKAKYWSKNNLKTPREVLKSTHDEYFFSCKKCNHEFDAELHQISSGYWCPYCNHKRLCNNDDCEFCYQNSFLSHEKSKFWSKNNKTINGKIVSPRNVFRQSNKSYLFKCNTCKEDFPCALNHIVAGNWCPRCINKTELKVNEWLKNNNYLATSQYKRSWCKNINTNKYFYFDFCIENFKVIIEIDGPQHFFQTSNWPSPAINLKRDKYKQKCALDNGFTIIRILQKDIHADNDIIINNKTFTWERLLKLYLHEYNEAQIIYLYEGEERKIHENANFNFDNETIQNED